MLRSQRELIVRKWYSPLCGCAGDRVEMLVKVHCGTVLGDEFAAMLKMRPPKQSHSALDNHLDSVSRATSKWRIQTYLFEEPTADSVLRLNK